MASVVKEEIPDADAPPLRRAPGSAALPPDPAAVIDLSSSDSDSDSESDGGEGKRSRAPDAEGECPSKKAKLDKGSPLPLGFLDPLAVERPEAPPLPAPPMASKPPSGMAIVGCKQFWKAGDYEGGSIVASNSAKVAGMDHVRVHPKFLHSNATSHKWALGALAELLDNSLDEVCNGATYVSIDMLENKKDGSRMLLIEDNGGGMDPDRLRQCMSLGYSAKSKVANTIGQYGNGFKTSTMRLGADVIVFSRSRGKEGRSPTQTIGMLSYTFLRDTRKEDIVVPMLDYEKVGHMWNKMSLSSSSIDWNNNLETMVKWSPYSSEVELLEQFSSMNDQGTRIVIYNLWEDDQGELELDFDADKNDIQVRGVNRDEQKIEMAKQFPNSRHFLTYRHSLRSYASILYLRLPHRFRMILRGKEIEHHNSVNDMMMKQEVTYRPQPSGDGVLKDPNMVAVVTLGFVKDAKDHVDVQGFNVYHKNRLIKPFWRVWNAAGSDGRGVIGVLEANFIEPAHDKQDFERTIVLSRLEARLLQLQKTYWSTNCHRIGYAPRRNKKQIEAEKESSPNSVSLPSCKSQDSKRQQNAGKFSSNSSGKLGKYAVSPIGSTKGGSNKNGNMVSARENKIQGFGKSRSLPQSQARGTPSDYSEESESEVECTPTERRINKTGGLRIHRATTRFNSKADIVSNGNGSSHEDSDLSVTQLKDENDKLRKRIREKEESLLMELQYERDRNKTLAEQLEAAKKKLEEANKEQEALIDIFSEERNRRDREEENLRKKLKDASLTIQELLEKLSSKNSLKP